MYREFDLIERISKIFGQPEGVTLGIGDDCAVLDPGRFDLVTTDTMVEGVHFRRDWSSPQDIGFKALAVSLSDVAAMGGGPGAFFLNLTLPNDEDEAFVEGLLEGLKEACVELGPAGFEVSAAGGDVTATRGPVVITTTLLGEASPAGPLMRSGAVPGDRIVILGPTGLAQAGVEVLEAGLDPDDYPALVASHRRPTPLVRQGALLGLYGIPSALIDVTDGLAQDLGHILARSKVGASIETHNLPRHDDLVAFCEATDADVLGYMLQGGEDLQLCFCVPPARMPKLWEVARREDWDVFDIGEVRGPDEGLRVLSPDGQPLDIETIGYQHFAD
jgi:thiamine-monophosphate kinase